MQVKLENLDHHLKKGQLASLYTLHGDELLLVNEASDALRTAARQCGYQQRKIIMVERNFCWSELFNNARSISLFDEKLLIDLRIANNKLGKEGAQALRDYATWQAANKEHTFTLITLPRIDSATQKTTWFNALDQHGMTIKIDKIENTRLSQWLTQRLAAQGYFFESNESGQHALQLLLTRVEGNLLAAHQEIQKIALLYPMGPLRIEQIQDAVLNVARYDVFKLTQAMLERDMAKVVKILDSLRGEGTAAVLVLWVVAEEIRLLCKLQQAVQQGQALYELMRSYRIWGPRERLIPEFLQTITSTKLQVALKRAAQLDRQVKGLVTDSVSTDIWDGLLKLISDLLVRHK